MIVILVVIVIIIVAAGIAWYKLAPSTTATKPPSDGPEPTATKPPSDGPDPTATKGGSDITVTPRRTRLENNKNCLSMTRAGIVQTWDCDDDYQVWDIGTTLQNKGTGKCIMVPDGADAKPGIILAAVDCNNGDAKQQWVRDENRKTYQNVASGLCVELRDGPTGKRGAAVVAKTCGTPWNYKIL
jgi:Ricin-type beta-trefoil lectin domain